MQKLSVILILGSAIGIALGAPEAPSQGRSGGLSVVQGPQLGPSAYSPSAQATGNSLPDFNRGPDPVPRNIPSTVYGNPVQRNGNNGGFGPAPPANNNGIARSYEPAVGTSVPGVYEAPALGISGNRGGFSSPSPILQGYSAPGNGNAGGYNGAANENVGGYVAAGNGNAGGYIGAASGNAGEYNGAANSNTGGYGAPVANNIANNYGAPGQGPAPVLAAVVQPGPEAGSKVESSAYAAPVQENGISGGNGGYGGAVQASNIAEGSIVGDSEYVGDVGHGGGSSAEIGIGGGDGGYVEGHIHGGSSGYVGGGGEYSGGEGGFAEGAAYSGHIGSGSGIGGGEGFVGNAGLGGGGHSGFGPAVGPVHVEYGETTHDEGPTTVREYHSHSHVVRPHHAVRHFQTHQHQAKKIIHNHHRTQKVIHKHHNHQHVIHQHHLHKVHLHNAHLQKEHVHQHNLHKIHIHQPIYVKHEQHQHKETEEHRHKNTQGESHSNVHKFQESTRHAPPIQAPGVVEPVHGTGHGHGWKH